MTWRVIYHEDVAADFQAIGQVEARTVLKGITKRIQNGEPDKLGKSLAGRLAGCRRIRTGSARIVYRVNVYAIEVLIIATAREEMTKCMPRQSKGLNIEQGFPSPPGVSALS